MKKPQPKPTLQDPQLQLLRSANCPTLSHRSNLTYELGMDTSKALHYSISANDGGGFFSPEWIHTDRHKQGGGKALEH